MESIELRAVSRHETALVEPHTGLAAHEETPAVLVVAGERREAPLVSIMIPTFRRPELLRDAIASALGQNSTESFEVVVVDNEQDSVIAAQVDDVVRSFDDPRLRLYRNSGNLGMFGNWNRCVNLARGDWLTILNDDDKLKPSFLSGVLENRRGNALIAADADYFGARYQRASGLGRWVRAAAKTVRDALLFRQDVRKISDADLFFGNPVRASLGVLLHKRSCIEIGGFREERWPIADYVFTTSYCLKYGGYLLNEKLASYRLEANESLKADTIVGFIVQNAALRKQLVASISFSHLSRDYLQTYSDWFGRLQATYYIRVFQGGGNSDYIANKAGIKFRRVPLVEYTMVAVKAITNIVFWLMGAIGWIRRVSQ